MKTIFCLVLIVSVSSLHAATLHVGNGQPYPDLESAIDVVEPGDLILIHEGTYAGGLFFADVQGTADDWIFIESVAGEVVVFEGGTNAWQFTDAAYLHISGIIFQHQTGNGVNFDDGGSYETPAHHVIFEACFFQDIDASGNNDLLKLSGLNDFEIRDCLFLNGAEGGSGIDMVGCHNGLITNCYFENMGSNGIQAKGGTQHIVIRENYFRNAGQRSLNLGGSTGLEFFRPIDAEFEAADLHVHANVFVGSVAPVAFVGCINSEVVNNTIYLPENWVLRILQETVDPKRFHPCGNNAFINNLIVINDEVNVVCNIGPNTAPETFTFSNNLWYHATDPNWSGPELPVDDPNEIVGEDPLLTDPDNDDFSINGGSPAVGQGLTVTDPVVDYAGNLYNNPRSIGAFEGDLINNTSDVQDAFSFSVFPNPVMSTLTLGPLPEKSALYLRSGNGAYLDMFKMQDITVTIPVGHLPDGVYVIEIVADGERVARLFMKGSSL